MGKLKWAPGTAASIVTCLFFLIFINYVDIYIIFIFTIFIFLYSFIAINKSFETFEEEDPQEIVIDEFLGQMIPLLALPIYETLYPTSKLYYCLIAFVIFRFFDIIKPFPINYIDSNIEGALGILLDDIVAGLLTVIIMIIIFFFIGG